MPEPHGAQEQSDPLLNAASLLANLASEIHTGLDRETVIRRALDGARQVFGCRDILIRLVDDAGVVVDTIGSWTDPEHGEAIGAPLPGGLTAHAISSREAVFTIDPAGDPRVAPANVRFGVKAIATLPLLGRQRCLGALGVYFTTPKTFPLLEQRLLQAFAATLATALENARLFAESDAHRRGALALAHVGRLVSQSLDVREVQQRIVESVRGLLDVPRSSLYTLDPGSGDLVEQAVSGSVSRTAPMHLRFPVGTGVVGLAVRDRAPRQSPDTLLDPRVTLTAEARARAEQAGDRAALGVPLMIKGTVVGALAMADTIGRTFTETEVQLAEAFADQAAIALENARLYQTQEVRAERLRILATLNQLISSSLDTDEVLGRIARAAVDLTHATFVEFWTADEAAEEMHLRVFSNPAIGTDKRLSMLRFGQGGVGWVAVHRQRLSIPDVFTDERVRAREWWTAHGLRSALWLPILFGEAFLGVLSVLDKKPVQLSPSDEDLLESFVVQAAVAIHNARLYHDLQLAHARLEQSQAQLIRGETLRATGELAAGAAHHLNNLLAVVIGRLDLALGRFAGSEVERHLKPAARAALDAAAVVKRLTLFSRSHADLALVPVDLNRLVEDIVELTRPRWQDEPQTRGLEIRVGVQTAELPPVTGDPAALREVLVNLVLNAVDAMPRGGTITITTGATEQGAFCAVRDTGTGMSPEIQRRVFEPFFTTKGVRSTGLGLSVNYGILQRHGGELTIDSVEGQGTTVTVRLPPAPILAEAATATTIAAPPTPLEILVIDDDPEVRSLLSEMLRQDGHRVTEATGGAEGLDRLAGDPSIDLVLTDLGMSGMTGWEVARAIKASRPALRVGLLTGWGEEPPGYGEGRTVVDFVLTKPLMREVLRRALASAPS